MSPRPRRSEQHNNLQEAIKETAWKQIAESGAAALSLRAIARDLGITAPAIYNYFPDRDALVTALIADAYKSCGDWQLAARDAVTAEDLIGRLAAVMTAYRRWAQAYPQRYQLIYGTPIPGYHAPCEMAVPAAHSMSPLATAVEAIRVAGKLNVAGFPIVLPEDQAGFDVWKNLCGDVDILSISVALFIWAHNHGIISLEIEGSLPPFGTTGDELYQYAMTLLLERIIKP